MRRAITLLQSAARFQGKQVTSEALFEAAGTVPEAEIADLLRLTRTAGFSDVHKKVKDMIKKGLELDEDEEAFAEEHELWK